MSSAAAERYALLSVTDKRGIVEFAQGLAAKGFALLSTGGTARVLREAGVAVTEVAEFTGFPEILDGRVKTLHPRVHGGLLARRDDDRAQMTEHGLVPIDVVAVNLYRFRETVARADAAVEPVPDEAIVEQIDIGGPSMIRSAAKNHASVAVVVDPDDYTSVLDAFGDDSRVPPELARDLAGKAFAHTAAYDTAVASWFARRERAHASPQAESALPEHHIVAADKVRDLRYGENPHQVAALYADPDARGATLARARQLGGKEPSYNNLLDLDAAFALCVEFDEPTCVVIKHATPCGVASAPDAAAAVEHAWNADSLSAFGGILALNRPVDGAIARVLVDLGTFVEAIVAPRIAPDAIEVLGEAKWGKNVRLLELGGWPPAVSPAESPIVLRPISGGYLAQTQDVRRPHPELDWVTAATAGERDEQAMRFAWAVCKHVRSNAIVLVHMPADQVIATCGIGGGQTSRVDAVKIAVDKAGERARGAVLASDAFFPFADGLEVATRAGIVAAIQPGGSRRDEEVITAANEAGIAMAFTGVRHFRH